jgi:putative transposase
VLPHPKISQRRQCVLLGVARSSLSYIPVPECELDRKIKRIMDELQLDLPCTGSRRMTLYLARDFGIHVNRKRVVRLRQEMGLEAIYCRPNTSLAEPSHKKFPYLLRSLHIDHADMVWCSDITYVPMPSGNAFLCAVMDWHTRKVLGWAVSNVMDVNLCLLALDRALTLSGTCPTYFNTDQGSQFTCMEWIDKLTSLGVKISMDGKGRWLDNVFIERLWRSVKYEDIYIRCYLTVLALELGMAAWFVTYNDRLPHSSLGMLTPSVFHAQSKAAWIAAQPALIG